MRVRRSPDVRGFTLFEVLAAVLVLGLFYTVLATKASQGLRAEGENLRRLEAGLIADEALARVEAGLAVGTTPPIDLSEEEDGRYTIAVEVAPLDLLSLLPEEVLLDEEYEGESLLALPNTGEQSFLRTVEVRVLWEEAAEPREIRRVTYAYDTSALQAFFPEEASADGESGGDDREPVDSPFVNEDGSANLGAMEEALRAMQEQQR